MHSGKETRYDSRVDYSQLLRYVFKRFSVRSAGRTLLPTLQYYATHPALPAGDKPALFTMNILPPMMTVWHHLARKNLGNRVDITVFDCSGKLDEQEFSGTHVQKFLNLYAATKSDAFLNQIARQRRIGWICDDDMFILDGKAADVVERELAVPNTASISFRPRSWWHFEMDGKQYPVSSSYCIAFNREIFVEKEHLSLRPADGNTHPSHIGKPVRRYDTADLANEMLLRKGYRCAIVPEEEREKYVTGFSGMSGAVMLLAYFTKPEQMMDYLESPPKERWSGNVLFGVLAGLLAISTIQECYVRLKGQPYPLRSLPTRAALDNLRRDREPYLRKDNSFKRVDDVSARLLASL